MKYSELTDDEKCKFSRILEHEIVQLSFRMEEMGTRPEAVAVKRWWSGQLSYYKHARKFCRGILKQLQRRDNFMGSERP